MRSCAVLHVTSLLGGGVDRHVRDIVRATGGRHVIWHVGESAEVVEEPADRRAAALDPARIDGYPEDMARWLAARGVGLVHAHSLSPRARGRAELAREFLGTRVIATLHDVLFLHPDAFSQGASPRARGDWLAENERFLRRAAAVIAPSAYIAQVARAHLDGIGVEIIGNGVEPEREKAETPIRPEFAEHPCEHVVAVLGAVGPHKGSELLEALARELEGTGIAIVVIGYLDRQIVPGWRRPGTYFIHGAYANEDVPGLLAGYGAKLALFPNQVPESFSYSLSDIWCCGLPVLAAPYGALGERIAAHGGGWLLAEGFDAPAVAQRLRELFSAGGAAEFARVESQLSQPDPSRVPSLATMARSLDALYERFGLDPARPVEADASTLERLLATNLDGSLFREELKRIADEYAQLERAHAQTLERQADLGRESREWIAKLDGDIAALKSDIEREVEARRSLGQENVQLAIHKAAFDKLPGVVRKWLLKKVLDARS
jgi:glycosyltransferase involved in cell wall biosynthesis